MWPMHHEMDNPIILYEFCFSHLPFETKYTSNSAYDNNHPSQVMTTHDHRNCKISINGWKHNNALIQTYAYNYTLLRYLPLKQALSILTIFGVIFNTLHKLANALPKWTIIE